MTAPGGELPIGAVAAMTGVNPITLRAWERRHGLIRPARTPKGRRFYTHEHVELIRRVLALIERGVPVGRVRAVLDASQTAPVSAATSPGGDRWSAYLERMSAAIVRFDEPEVDAIYDEALALHRIARVTDRLLLPLLERLGERWQSLPGGIAEEHFFATYLRGKLGARLQHSSRSAAGPRLLAACAPGERHEIGLLLFALAAHGAGLRTVLLGADLPLSEIASAQRRAACDAVVISSSIEPEPTLLVRELPALVIDAGVPVFVGGPTALRHRRAIAAAGALPLGIDTEAGAAEIRATLEKRRTTP